MGRCGNCRSHTQHFCFVHQEFVCDKCLINQTSTIHDRCVVSTYRSFLIDSSYSWPPVCGACEQSLDLDGDHIRRACLHIEHTICIERAEPPKFPCKTCDSPLLGPLPSPELIGNLRLRSSYIPNVSKYMPPKTEEEAYSTAARQSPKSSASLLVVPDFPQSQSVLMSATSQPVSTATDPVSQQAHQPFAHQGRSTQLGMSEQSRLSVTGSHRLPERLIDVENSGSSQIVMIKHQTKALLTNSLPGFTRKALKAANRRTLEFRHTLQAHPKPAVFGALFIVCVILVIFLSSGEIDVGTQASEHTNADVEVFLPHVRVNPAIAAEARTGGASGQGSSVLDRDNARVLEDSRRNYLEEESSSTFDDDSTKD